MRLHGISAKNIPPIKHFEVEGLSDIVVIAGRNGVGKTRLMQQIVQAFQTSGGQQLDMRIALTSHNERTKAMEVLGVGLQDVPAMLDTTIPQHAAVLTKLLQQNQRRKYYKSGVLTYESDRTIANVQPLPAQLEYPDPDSEELAWNFFMQPLKNRFQDTQHAIFKKYFAQDKGIASRARALKKRGQTTMKLNFEDVLLPFRESFSKLLSPKSLTELDLRGQRIMYADGSMERAIDTLSSGEKEVVNITFDFLLREPSDCIVFFDEPELHLHPELLTRLISTLRSVGKNNQFILVSHSPDLISSSLDDTVVFLAPPTPKRSNQAILVGRDSDADEAAEALHRLGQSIGVVALGKKIVLIEGTNSSLDKKTYSEIVRNRFPNLALLPSEGKGNLEAFDRVVGNVLSQSIWGVEFYMLADKDASPGEIAASKKFRTLPRYHLENYFLDPVTLSQCFAEMCEQGDWQRDADKVQETLLELARACLPYAVNLIVARKFRFEAGNVDLTVRGCDGLSSEEIQRAIEDKRQLEITRITEATERNVMQAFTVETYNKLSSALDTNEWRSIFPGRRIFNTFARRAGIQPGRLKNLYIKRAEEAGYTPFDDLISIFADFAQEE